MKTPMKEMFDQLKASRKDEYGLAFAIDMLLENKQEMLEKEKEMMCGFGENVRGAMLKSDKHRTTEEVYNETFNTKEKMVEDEMDYKKEYYRLYQEVAEMLVENIRNYKTPMTPFELLLRWDEIREVKNTFNTKEK